MDSTDGGTEFHEKASLHDCLDVHGMDYTDHCAEYHLYDSIESPPDSREYDF